MPRPNSNFVIGLVVTIITLLDSTIPKHFNTKILQVSLLVLSFARYGTKNVTQKFPNFVMES
jgi:hypothetical protein